MTPEERQLITGLFDRMRGFGAPEKDRDAEALISDAVRSTPNAPYMLVQSVLVQEHALQEAEKRIRDLEEQVRDLQQDAPKSPPAGSGSFLGGLFGGGRPASQPGPSSVPAIGSRPPAQAAYDDEQRRPWAQNAAPQSGPFSSGGSGFLRSAMATAAGVAGGMLAAGAIRDLMGGHAANTNTTAAANNPASNASSGTDTASADQARQDWEQDMRQDAADDDSSWGDDGGGDMDI